VAAPTPDSKESTDWGLAGLAPTFRKLFDGLTTPRARLNWERSQTLIEDPEFLARLEQIRQKEGIPKNLNPENDVRVEFVPHGDEDVEVVESYFLDYEANAKRRADIEKAINALLVEYVLPLNFYDWVQHMLLYRKPPRGTPRYNWELLWQLSKDPTEVERVPLSTAEKKFWLSTFRTRLGLKVGRMPKKYANAYGQLKALFAKSKNTLRRSPTMDDTLYLIDLQKRAAKKGAAEKFTYRDAVAELTDLETETEFDREAATLRQRKSRHLRRFQRLKKPEK
jgi:hypothetical protein